MSDILSQNEIDNLLQALSSGEVDAEEMKASSEKQVKNYDFSRPSKFSKEHLRTLEIIFEHYGRLLSGLSAQKHPGRSDEFRGSHLYGIFKFPFQSGASGNR